MVHCIGKTRDATILQYIDFFPSEAIHQRILLYNNLVIARAITKLLYSKVLNSHKENNIMCVSSLY